MSRQAELKAWVSQLVKQWQDAGVTDYPGVFGGIEDDPRHIEDGYYDWPPEEPDDIDGFWARHKEFRRWQ